MEDCNDSSIESEIAEYQVYYNSELDSEFSKIGEILLSHFGIEHSRVIASLDAVHYRIRKSEEQDFIKKMDSGIQKGIIKGYDNIEGKIYALK